MAIAADTRHLYALGSCGYAGGLTRVTLSSGNVTKLATRPESEICGEQIALRNLFNRYLSCLFHCLVTQQTYDEAKAFPVISLTS